MNNHINTIAGRLSLRFPQRRSLEILDRITEIIPPGEDVNLTDAIAIVQSEFPSVSDFEREFPSLCFALATGVGKTRLMGAFISYLHLAHGLNNFFVLAPNLTIYNKLIADFTPNTSKYVFKGIAEFAIEQPLIVTGDNYDSGISIRHGWLPGVNRGVVINIFNISKINSEVRGGKSPRIKRLSEYIGESYFDYLAGLDDLVLIMDESHRYRASAGVKAINDLKPVLGLELTATPFVETAKGPVQFKNVIYDYPLGKAMADGFVKEPAVVTRKDFNPSGMTAEEIERLKLEDGIWLHESVKAELETYARTTGNSIVKPFLLIIARDTTHAGQLLRLIQSDIFFGGRYSDKVIQVDSSKTGAEEDEMIQRLLAVESTDEPTEIVIHVNMLKEGWDVTNLYTIVPLRAANARILIEQSIGRGLRLPYGKKTGVPSVDRLNIVAHDRFQEIIDEANRPDSKVHLQQVIIESDQLQKKTTTFISQPLLISKLQEQPDHSTEELKVAEITYKVIRDLQSNPQTVPSVTYLQKPEIQEVLRDAVRKEYEVGQAVLPGVKTKVDIESVVAKTSEIVGKGTINIPRIVVLPKGLSCGYKPFALKFDVLNYPAPTNELWIQYLRTNQSEVLEQDRDESEQMRLEDYIVNSLKEFDDVAYDEHADLLYDLARQAVSHFKTYLNPDDVRRVLRLHQREIAHDVHTQLQDHYWEEAVVYETKVSQGYSVLKEVIYTVTPDMILDFRQAPTDKNNIAKYLFNGFSKCLYTEQKFQSDPERKLAVILEREADKWFRPALGQFQIYYRTDGREIEYQPDFVAETDKYVYMLEPKARNEMNDQDVRAKANAAVRWCKQATDYAATWGGKQWRYLLIPHDAIAENISLDGLAFQYEIKDR